MYRFIKIYDVQYFESNTLMREIYNYLFRKKPPDYSNIYNYKQQINLKPKTKRLNNYLIFPQRSVYRSCKFYPI